MKNSGNNKTENRTHSTGQKQQRPAHGLHWPSSVECNSAIQPGRTSHTVVAVALFVAIMLAGLSLATVHSAPQPRYVAVPIVNWTAAASLPQVVTGWNAIVHDDTVYFLGGRDDTGEPIAAVYMAAIRTDGSLDDWNNTTSLPDRLYLHSVSATDSHVYLVGGWDGEFTQAKVWRAPFLSSGGLGSWQSMIDYPVSLDLHSSVIVNDRLYVIGGWNGTAPLADVRYADIGTSGLGEWQSTTTLPKALYRHAVAAHDGYVYVTGGFDGTTAQVQVYAARVMGDGRLGNWEEIASLPAGRFYHRTVVHDGRLVVLGGTDDSSNGFTSVYAAPIGDDGQLGAWTTETALPQPLYRFAAVSVTKYGSDYIYVLGGLSNNELLDRVYYSTAPEPPTPTPTPTPTPQPTIDIALENEPAHWIPPGEDVTYVISYRNSGAVDVTQATLRNVIPNQTELIPDSVTAGGAASGSQPGSILSWELGELTTGEEGEVSYSVRRITPTPVSTIQRPLSIGLAAPAAANAGEPIVYTLTITNEVPIELTNLVVTNTLPYGADYVEGSGGTLTGGVVTWTIPSLPPDQAGQPGQPRVPSTASVQYAVSAVHTLVNSDYRVEAVPETGSGPGPAGIGDDIRITRVGDTPPVGPGDGVTILNDGATLSWLYQDVAGQSQTNSVRNPALLTEAIYLPIAVNEEVVSQ